MVKKNAEQEQEVEQTAEEKKISDDAEYVAANPLTADELRWLRRNVLA